MCALSTSSCRLSRNSRILASLRAWQTNCFGKQQKMETRYFYLHKRFGFKIINDVPMIRFWGVILESIHLRRTLCDPRAMSLPHWRMSITFETGIARVLLAAFHVEPGDRSFWQQGITATLTPCRQAISSISSDKCWQAWHASTNAVLCHERPQKRNMLQARIPTQSCSGTRWKGRIDKVPCTHRLQRSCKRIGFESQWT